MVFRYDVVVVGAGHAGCEAASAAATMGSRTLLITMDMNKIGQMSCNPAVGGIAKGQIVREIDALGGQMGLVTDASAIQFRMLNRSKGPAMWSPRAQSDRKEFINAWTHTLTSIPNLHIWQDTVLKILVESGRIIGVSTSLGVDIYAGAVILTNGTFLNGLLHFGAQQIAGGRISEPASYGITEQLCELGFATARMKTGTPCRLDKRSIDFSRMVEQQGESDFHKFSYLIDNQIRTRSNGLKQMSCWITNTNEQTHQILREGLPYSPLYNGQIQSIGPRYCPSIETKIVTFPDKPSHQLFIEPEGVDSNEYYVNGFSSSLPMEVQMRALRTVTGLENAVFYRPGYAIEYNFFDPTQLKHTLETKLISNLFFAGQINGTTGYEEAAGQGLVAGINAHYSCHGGGEFSLRRDEAYIGVLIDDLVTKGVDEPYRMFTSRAEYRILLRQDNADARLTEKAYLIGMATSERYNLYREKRDWVERIRIFLTNTLIKQADINPFLESIHSAPVQHSVHLNELLLRPEITLLDLVHLHAELHALVDSISNRRDEIIEEAEIDIKYEGYTEREKQNAAKLQRLDSIRIPANYNYDCLQSLSTEARQKLSRIRPQTIGQASRIPGVSPNDISVLLVLMGR